MRYEHGIHPRFLEETFHDSEYGITQTIYNIDCTKLYEYRDFEPLLPSLVQSQQSISLCCTRATLLCVNNDGRCDYCLYVIVSL